MIIMAMLHANFNYNAGDDDDYDDGDDDIDDDADNLFIYLLKHMYTG